MVQEDVITAMIKVVNIVGARPQFIKYFPVSRSIRQYNRTGKPVIKDILIHTGQHYDYFMSKVFFDEFRIRADRAKKIAGAVHVDGTARIQYLEKREDNHFLWDLLLYLEDHYSIDCIINTSFNARGEPIVNTLSDASSTASRIGVKKIVLNGKPISV